jgi:hypothetical protein
MRRFIITGAPGAGKTAIIRQLELDGFSVVEEAATDVLAAARAQGRLNSGDIPRSLTQSPICKGTVRFEPLINRMRFSFTGLRHLYRGARSPPQPPFFTLSY